jgi:hypothetical protein
MNTTPIACNDLPSVEAGLFHQIAMFSASGLALSMTLVIVGGFRILSPWI